MVMRKVMMYNEKYNNYTSTDQGNDDNNNYQKENTGKYPFYQQTYSKNVWA